MSLGPIASQTQANVGRVFGIEVIYHASDEWFACRAVMDIVVHDPDD
jgi:hypothetical protein